MYRKYAWMYVSGQPTTYQIKSKDSQSKASEAPSFFLLLSCIWFALPALVFCYLGVKSGLLVRVHPRRRLINCWWIELGSCDVGYICSFDIASSSIHSGVYIAFLVNINIVNGTLIWTLLYRFLIRIIPVIATDLDGFSKHAAPLTHSFGSVAELNGVLFHVFISKPWLVNVLLYTFLPLLRVYWVDIAIYLSNLSNTICVQY